MGWYNAMFSLAGGNTYLNETIIFAACHAERAAVVTTSVAVLSSSSTAAASTVPRGSSQATATSTGTPAPTSGSVSGRDGFQTWMLASIGLLAVVVNSVSN